MSNATSVRDQLTTLGFEPVHAEDSPVLCGYFGRSGRGPSGTTHVATWSEYKDIGGGWSIERLNPKHGGTSGSRFLANSDRQDSDALSEMLARCDRITQRQSGEEPVFCGLWGYNNEEKPDDLR